MFGKLMKHEFIATRRVVPYVYLSAIAAALWMVAASYQSKETPLIIGGILLFCLLLSGVVATFVMIVRRFSQHLFGKEGYLTHTLPTTPAKLLGAKLLSGCLWLLASIAVMGVCLLIIYWFSNRNAGIMTEIHSFGLNDVLSVLGITKTYAIFGVLLPAILGALGSLAEGLLVIYFAITLSQTRWFSRWSGGSAVLLVLGISMLLSWANIGFVSFLSVLGLSPFDTSLFITQNGWMFSDAARHAQMDHIFRGVMQIEMVSLAFNILVGVGLFFGCRALMEKAIALR